MHNIIFTLEPVQVAAQSLPVCILLAFQHHNFPLLLKGGTDCPSQTIICSNIPVGVYFDLYFSSL